MAWFFSYQLKTQACTKMLAWTNTLANYAICKLRLHNVFIAQTLSKALVVHFSKSNPDKLKPTGKTWPEFSALSSSMLVYAMQLHT
jgi:hypothetical protein